jgi:hypothetical protein
MANAQWHEYGLPRRQLPMNRLTDTDRDAVAAYILSLR